MEDPLTKARENRLIKISPDSNSCKREPGRCYQLRQNLPEQQYLSEKKKGNQPRIKENKFDRNISGQVPKIE